MNFRTLCAAVCVVITLAVTLAGGQDVQDVLEQVTCLPFEVVPGFSVDACVGVYFNTCSLAVEASVEFGGSDVFPRQSVDLSQELCVPVETPLLNCDICFSLGAGDVATTSGFTGCFDASYDCGALEGSLGDFCFDVGDPFECEFDSCWDCVNAPNCGWCIADQKCYLGNDDGPKCETCGDSASCPWFFNGCPAYNATCPKCPEQTPCPEATPCPDTGPTGQDRCVSNAASQIDFCADVVNYNVFVQADFGTVGGLDAVARATYDAVLMAEECVTPAQDDAAKEFACLSAFPPCANDGQTRSAHCRSTCERYVARYAGTETARDCDGDGALSVCDRMNAFTSLSGCYVFASTTPGTIDNNGGDDALAGGSESGGGLGVLGIAIIVVGVVAIAAVVGIAIAARRRSDRRSRPDFSTMPPPMSSSSSRSIDIVSSRDSSASGEPRARRSLSSEDGNGGAAPAKAAVGGRGADAKPRATTALNLESEGSSSGSVNRRL